MTKKLTWKNGEILSKDTRVGRIGTDENVEGYYELNNTQIHFTNRDILKVNTKLANNRNETMVNISFKKGKRQAIITLDDGTEYLMKKTGFLKSSWSIEAYGNKIMDFKKRSKEGEINFFFENEVLILAGIHVLNQN